MQKALLKDLNYLSIKIDLNLFYDIDLAHSTITLQGRLTTETILACGKLDMPYDVTPEGWTVFKQGWLVINLSK